MSHVIKKIIWAPSKPLPIKRVLQKQSEYKTFHGKKIPSPEGALPFLGHLLKMRKYTGVTLSQWQKKLGPIFKIKIGTVNWVVISNPEICHDLLANDATSNRASPPLIYVVVRAMSPSSVDSLSRLMEAEALKVIDIMKIYSNENQGIDVCKYCHLAAVNVVMSTLFGIAGSKNFEDLMYKQISTLNSDLAKLLKVSNDYTILFPILKVLDPILRRGKGVASFAEVKVFPFVRELIDLARKSTEDNLVKKIDNIKDEYGIDDRGVLSITTEMIFIGLDNISSATAWSIAILCNYPEAQKRSYEEINDFIIKNARYPTYLDRNDLPYTAAVIKECIRFRGTLLIGGYRETSKDLVYKDYVIPKGYVIVENFFYTNKDPSLFPEPEKFDPERFINDNRSIYTISNGGLSSRSFFRFGWGKRICPGIYITETQMFHILTKIIFAYTISPIISDEGKEIYPDLDKFNIKGISMSPIPFNVRLVERKGKTNNT
ncbi:cytochrome P450 [Sporodiniella umbellata]|nr:cytochrome P450 [Sporodiniella umbellata]